MMLNAKPEKVRKTRDKKPGKASLRKDIQKK